MLKLPRKQAEAATHALQHQNAAADQALPGAPATHMDELCQRGSHVRQLGEQVHPDYRWPSSDILARPDQTVTRVTLR